LVSWKSKKAFFYFGGAFIILLGGVIILNAPYHYLWFVARPGENRPFSVWEGSGYYPQMEFTFSVTPDNGTEVDAEIAVRNNESETVHLFNLSLTSSDAVGPITARQFRRSSLLDLEVEDYSLIILRVDGVDYVEIELTQTSDSRLYIVAGGSLNIFGLFMQALGYMVAGSFLPTGDEIIVDWGFDDMDDDKEKGPDSPFEPNITG
jgi:hypothetical protein